MDEKMLAQLAEISTAIEKRLGEGEKVSKDAEGRVLVLEDQLKAIEAKHAELSASIEKREWANVPGVNEGKDKDRFSLCKTINAIATKSWASAGYEKEVIDAAQGKKTMSADTDTAGGYLIPTQAIQNVIDLLRNNLVVQQLGATMMNDLVGIPVEIPKVTSGSTAQWIDENATITASQMALGQVKLNPKGLAAMTQLSNRLLALSVPSAEALVRQDLAQTLAEALDLAALRGTGLLGQPLGIANTPGISTVDFAGTTAAAGYYTNPGWEALYDMEGALADANALKGNVGFAFHPNFKRNISKIRTPNHTADVNDGNFLVNPATDAQLTALLGYKFSQTTQIPLTLGGSSDQTEVYMANWADLLIGQWVGLSILASQEAGTAFVTNQTWVRMITDVDVQVRRPESFVLGSNVEILPGVSAAS
jgi:HK97 family phage major capsid protein